MIYILTGVSQEQRVLIVMVHDDNGLNINKYAGDS